MKINVGLVGYGVVGKGFTSAILDNTDTIFRKTGLDINLEAVADLYIEEKRGADMRLRSVPILTQNAQDILTNKDIHIIVELAGGITFAKELITNAIKAGKHVVTANKALLAHFGRELFTLAKDNGVELAFEASCGGGIPIINVLKNDLVANNITEITAIINGTANYILTRMSHDGTGYTEALKQAQELGYAEQDPAFDVDGIDSAHKITLLASLAFGTWVDFAKVYTEGITRISGIDISFAKELDCAIKLLAIAKREGGYVEVRVHPTIIPNSYRLAQVKDSFNALQVKGDIVGETFHYGRGAGSLPTGSAVAADVISIARDIQANAVARVPTLGFKKTEEIPMKDIKDVCSAYYLRFMTEDVAGVLSSIAGVLARNQISIRSALQRPVGDESVSIPIVFLTHIAEGHRIEQAVREISLLPFLKEIPVAIRVEGLR